jgi:undecaprenyl-diphosphatase
MAAPINDEMNYLQILILALIQGAAELLPISSSAHVILAAKLMHLEPKSPEFVFLLVMLHTGTMFAVIYYFWPRWRWLLSRTPQSLDMTDHSRLTTHHSPSAGMTRGQFLKMIFVATACTGVLGLTLKYLIEKVVLMGMLHREKAAIEDLFESLPLIAIALFAVGIFIIVAGLAATPQRTGENRENEGTRRIGPFSSLFSRLTRLFFNRGAPNSTGAVPLSTRTSIWIGLIQGLCLPFRGFSRSGATISMALFCGAERRMAEDFSFALAVVLTPPVIGRGLYRLLREAKADTHVLDLLLPGLVGMVFSFMAGLVALKVLSAALEKGRWQYFGYYCIFASLVVLAAAIRGY